MSDIEFGRQIMGYQPGQTIQGAELEKFEREYEAYRKKALTDWQLRTDQQGQMVRANPTTGLVMAMTNAQGQPVMAGTSGSQDPYAAYMSPGVAGADPAADMTNSAAFAGVPAQPVPTAAPAGNPVVPVNVNPAAPAAVATPSPTPMPVVPAAAAAKVYRTENDVIADARAGYISKEQAQEILVNQFGFDP